MSYPQLPVAERITVHEKEVDLNQLPAPLRVDEDLGILTFPEITGQVVYRAGNSLFECRASKTPDGDYLLMFPTETKGWVPQNEHDACHYGRKLFKSNDLVAMRSSNQGNTWTEARPAFDIDYNQHGFIPLIPRGSRRIYCFGTQPIWQVRSAIINARIWTCSRITAS